MCGIAGVISPGAVDCSSLESMLARLGHRGPDDRGWLLSGGGRLDRGRGPVPATPATVALGHTRLSIIDLSTAGWQPMTSPDDRYALTFNGEIYNYLELRSELVDRGWEFRSRTDTEVLLAGWASWGPKILERVTGMFACCMVDFLDRRAYLVRDHFGIKPLFLARAGGGLIFASEIGAILAHGQVCRSVDAAMAYDYLRFGHVDHNEGTLLAAVTRLPAATVMEVDLDDPAAGRSRRYWTIPTEERPCSFGEAVDAVRDSFEQSIRLHLRADVPVGTALSGGIDSSAIVAMARRVAGESLDLHSFSYIADDARFDESRWVRRAADRAGAKVHTVHADSVTLRADLEDLIRSQGEPFGGTSIYAQRRVFAAARAEGVPVLLDGQGADELFGGYRAYLAARFGGLVRRGHFVSSARLAAGVMKLPDVRMTPRSALRVAATAAPSWMRPALLRGAGLEPFPSWMHRGWFEDRGVSSRSKEVATGLSGALVSAFAETSLPALLRYEDRNSMRFSVESRVPFLERDFVELVFGLPREHIVGPDGTTKWVFREAMRGIVPDPILDRRDKIGFTTPEDAWLRASAPWVSEVIDRAGDAPWCDAALLRSTARSRLASAAPSDHLLWRWLNLTLWAEVVDAVW